MNCWKLKLDRSEEEIRENTLIVRVGNKLLREGKESAVLDEDVTMLFWAKQFSCTCAIFQSIPIWAQVILRDVIKPSCLLQLQAVGPCMNSLEVCRGVQASWGSMGEKRPLFSFSPLPAGQSCWEPVLGFTPKGLFVPCSTTNPLLVPTETLPNKQRALKDKTLAHTHPWQGGWLGVLTQLQREMPPSGGLFGNKTCPLTLRQFCIWNAILFLNWNTFPPSLLSPCPHLPQR